MAFIKKLIGPDEQMIGITTIHWIYGAKGLLWLASLMIFASALDFGIDWTFAEFQNNPGILSIKIMSGYVFWFLTAMGVLLFFFYFLMMVTTEVGLTTKRIIFKKSWIFVSVKEIDLEEIKAADIDNGILGRFLNYGYISVDARFVENVILPAVADPYRFIKAMNEARSLLKQSGGTMNVVLDGDSKPEEMHIEKKGGKKKRVQKAQVETPPEPPAHKIDEDRYAAVDQTPGEAMREVVSDAGQNLRQAVGAAQTQTQQVLPQQGPSDLEPQPAAGPTIFPRDPKQRKEELRQRFKAVFTRRSNKKAS